MPLKQKILIVGAGFAGIKTALDLSLDVRERFAITLVSPEPEFRYYPALYRTATGGAVAGSRIPLADLFKGTSVQLVSGSAETLDRKAKTITLEDKTMHTYDTLVLGLGAVTNYFGIPGMAENSYGIKSFETIERFKHHLHQQLADDRRPDLNYVIVGAGPTGIELAGALPEYLHRIMGFHDISRRSIHVDLIEAGPRLLPRMPKATSRAVTRRLRKLGVKIYTKSTVQGLSSDKLQVNGKQIRSHTVIWTAGTAINPFFAANNFAVTPRGRVQTDMYLQAEDGIYIVGDNANTPFTGMAQTALHDGVYVAETIKRRASGRSPKSYIVKTPITVIPVGEHWATVIWGKIHLSGALGWLMREAADLVAFADYQPWWKAGRQWLTGLQSEETCPTCAAAMRRHALQD